MKGSVKLQIVLIQAKKKTSDKIRGFAVFDFPTSVACRHNYLFENWEAFLAFFRPYFFLSFILESLVRNPAAFSGAL